MSSGVKVVHLSSVHPPFDTRIFLKECRTLAANGYLVTFVVPHEKDELRDGVRIRAVPVPKKRRERMIATAWRVYRAALEEKADLYHFHDSELIPYGWLLKLSGKRVIYDVHEDTPKQILSKSWIHPFLRRSIALVTGLLECWSAHLFDKTVVVTPAVARRFPKHKTALVQNYPILGELLDASEEDASSTKNLIAFVGGITEIYGVKEMVIATSLLPEEANATLVLAGTFAPPNLEDGVSQLPGWQHTEARGWQSRRDVAKLLAQSRVGLVLYHPEPNHIEAQPNKLFEYMSAGVPVVASDFPLWREIVDGAKCGLLVDPLNPQAIAEAIYWLLTHPDEAETMGQSGLHAVRTKYNWSTEGQKLLEVYEGLLR